MSLSEHMRSALVIGSAIALTPLIMRGLSRMAPPRDLPFQDIESLKRKYQKTETWSQVAAFVGMFGALGVGLLFGKNTPWLIGLLFGWMALAPVIYIAFATLSRSRSSWDEFWIFYELKYKVGLRFIFPLYGFLGILALISTAALLIQK